MAERKLRLLCIDGGGVRGLSALFILKQLMEAVNRKNPPKPCNYFDMIGGTSTGGLGLESFSSNLAADFLLGSSR
jgi:patatin-like phospholipase/acyl hydrolase